MTSLAGRPNIVRIVGADLDASPPYFVMEYCPLGSLRSWVGQRAELSAILCAVAFAANGLAQLHARGGFHRDVKPDNLLVVEVAGPRGTGFSVKVGDLGLARTPETLGSPMTRGFGGTPNYIAPEVLAGKEFRSSADVYSLGVTACELLTGSRDLTDLGRVRIPPALATLIRRMTDSDERTRPSCRRVVKELQKVARQVSRPAEVTTVLAQLAPPTASTPTRQSSGNWWKWALGGLAAGWLLAQDDGGDL